VNVTKILFDLLKAFVHQCFRRLYFSVSVKCVPINADKKSFYNTRQPAAIHIPGQNVNKIV